jgi:hypothetical protein
VKVVLHNDVAVQPETMLVVKEAERGKEDLDLVRIGEERDPVDDRAAEKVRTALAICFVSGSWH